MDGLMIKKDNNTILISGTSDDLQDFIDYITKLINEKSINSHIHLDDLTLISKSSEIKELIIEKIVKGD